MTRIEIVAILVALLSHQLLIPVFSHQDSDDELHRLRKSTLISSTPFACDQGLDLVVVLDGTENVGKDAFNQQIELAIEIAQQSQQIFSSGVSIATAVMGLSSDDIGEHARVQTTLRPFNDSVATLLRDELIYDNGSVSDMSYGISTARTELIVRGRAIESTSRLIIVMSSTFPTDTSIQEQREEFNNVISNISTALHHEATIVMTVGFKMPRSQLEKAANLSTFPHEAYFLSVLNDINNLSMLLTNETIGALAMQMSSRLCASVSTINTTCVETSGSASILVRGVNLYRSSTDSLQCHFKHIISDNKQQKQKLNHSNDTIIERSVFADWASIQGDAMICHSPRFPIEGLTYVTIGVNGRLISKNNTQPHTLMMVESLSQCDDEGSIMIAAFILTVIAIILTLAFCVWILFMHFRKQRNLNEDTVPLLTSTGSLTMSREEIVRQRVDADRVKDVSDIVYNNDGQANDNHMIEDDLDDIDDQVLINNSRSSVNQSLRVYVADPSNSIVQPNSSSTADAYVPYAQRKFKHDVKASDKYVWPNQGGGVRPMRVEWGDKAPPSAPPAATENDAWTSTPRGATKP